MASLQSRLSSLITAIGADIKALKKVTIFDNGNTVDDTEQPTRGVEWRVGGPGGALVAKITEINPIESAVVVDRSELWMRVKSRTGGASADRMLLDSNGKSGLTPVTKTLTKASDTTTISTEVALSVSDTITVSGPNDVVLFWATVRGNPGGGSGANGVRTRVYIDTTVVDTCLIDNFLNAGQSQSAEAAAVSNRITGLSAGTHTLAMKAVRSAGTATSNSITAEGTTLTYMIIPNGNL